MQIKNANKYEQEENLTLMMALLCVHTVKHRFSLLQFAWRHLVTLAVHITGANDDSIISKTSKNKILTIFQRRKWDKFVKKLLRFS